MAEAYLGVERVRFGDRLQVDCRIEPGLEAEPVPPLILQPLVENAVRHGLAHLLEGGRIELSAERRASGGMRLRVGNPCDPDRPRSSGQGIGLVNVRQRLAAAFDDRAELRIMDQEHDFAVELILPVAALAAELSEGSVSDSDPRAEDRIPLAAPTLNPSKEAPTP